MATVSTTIENIRLFLISPSPMNPRKSFDKEALQELADNIEKQGLLQPITVRPTAGMVKLDKKGIPHDYEYEIVCGERRYRACSILKMETIPCIVREMSDDEALDAMITENLQRRDVDPVEEAEAFRLLRERGASTEELALRFGKSQAYVANRIRLTALIPELRKCLSAGTIPLAGAYRLARLTEADQREFAEHEIRGEDDVHLSVDDIDEWIVRQFRTLWRASFQNGEDLTEKWNPKGELIRRCADCECNTANHGCLFADMNTKEPQCTDAVCYERKRLVHIDWILQKDADRFVVAGMEPTKDTVAIICDDSKVYGDEQRRMLADLKQKCEDRGWRIFAPKELPDRLWGEGDIRDKVEGGLAVRCINLHFLANYYRGYEDYRLLPHPEEAAGATLAAGGSDNGYLRSRLCERKADIERKTDTRIANYAKKNFDEGKYVGRLVELEDWEKTVLWAIIYEQVDFMERDSLIPGTRYSRPKYRQMKEFRERMDKEEGVEWMNWMRRAIVKFIKAASNDTYLVEAIRQQSAEASAAIDKIRTDANKRIDAIDRELKDMGYDENGNKV